LRRIAVALGDLRAHLAAGTPVVLGLVVFETLFRPAADGRVADPPAGAKPRGRHAVLAVGHQPGAVLIRNSWGVTWAVAGYGWISDAYVATHVPDAWVVDPATRTAPGGRGTSHSSHEQGTIYGTS
jgi:C1A family cysteine protease